MSALDAARREMSVRGPLRIPPWACTIRVRLAMTYSALLFGITALILTAVYLALSRTIAAAPLDPLTVKKFYRTSDGTITYKPGQEFQVADLESVQRAVSYTSLQTLQRYSIVALAVMFALSLLIGWWVAGRALRPVGAITRATQEITATDLSRRIDAHGPPDELRTLADTIDGMLERLSRAFKAERMLVEDISHELRNPVAVVQANVEAVLGNEHSTPQQRHVATEVVLQATHRMSRLLEDLLATARIRSESFTDRDVALAQIAVRSAQEYRLLAAQRGIKIAERIRTSPLVYADPDVLALGNLFSNAVRLAPENSTITVGIGSRQGWAWAAVRDEGPGIPEDVQQRIFDRFYRGPGENRAGGTGLGLAIARQIIESHEGKLHLTRSGPDGSTFVIWVEVRLV